MLLELTDREQRAVRVALRFLRLRFGAWPPLADELEYKSDTLQRMMSGTRSITPRFALSVARLAGVSIDDILSGRWPPRADGQIGLTEKEQRAVKTALRVLRIRHGSWGPLADELNYRPDSLQRIASGTRSVTPRFALDVARVAGVSIDELLTGEWLSPRVCPHCGRAPSDFVEEDTVIVEAAP